MKGIFINAEKNLIQVFQAINLLFTVWAHSRGEHTIRNVKFLSKNFILTKPQHFHKFFTPIFFSQFFSWNQSCQQLKSPKPQHFHEFFTQIFLTIFLVKSKLSTAKKSKITTFSRIFHPNKIDNFSHEIKVSPTSQHFHEFFTQKIDNYLRKSKLNFWTKNEVFEQCGGEEESSFTF